MGIEFIAISLPKRKAKKLYSLDKRLLMKLVISLDAAQRQISKAEFDTGMPQNGQTVFVAQIFTFHTSKLSTLAPVVQHLIL
jgi:hypothetical protein